MGQPLHVSAPGRDFVRLFEPICLTNSPGERPTVRAPMQPAKGGTELKLECVGTYTGGTVALKIYVHIHAHILQTLPLYVSCKCTYRPESNFCNAPSLALIRGAGLRTAVIINGCAMHAKSHPLWMLGSVSTP